VEALVAMHADADAVCAVLDEEDEPVVLVGHSYGGVVITDAAAGQENVKHLVYVTSVMPERGETLVSFGESEFSPWTDPRDEDGTMGVKAEPAPAVFM
jgi:pimeloyl-ACP methyl ester carboxylesterase